jgi:hypothetical protein
MSFPSFFALLSAQKISFMPNPGLPEVVSYALHPLIGHHLPIGAFPGHCVFPNLLYYFRVFPYEF